MAKIDSEQIDKLLVRARQGDRRAFSEIVRIMMNPVTALTYKMTKDRDSALDLAQDTFVSAWQNLGSFKGEARFESWLYRIASNKSLNFIKRQSRIAGEDAIASMPSTADPERDMQQTELRQRVFEFMTGLPDQQKLVFELRFYKQLSFDEVSKVTDKALGTVKTLYREAVKKLRHVAAAEGWNQ